MDIATTYLKLFNVRKKTDSVERFKKKKKKKITVLD